MHAFIHAPLLPTMHFTFMTEPCFSIHTSYHCTTKESSKLQFPWVSLLTKLAYSLWCGFHLIPHVHMYVWVKVFGL